MRPALNAIHPDATVPGDLSTAWTKLSEPAEQWVGLSGASLAFDPTHGLGILFGGRDPNGTLLNDTWLNDGDHPGQWAEAEGVANSSPPPLANAALTYEPATGDFLLFGGELASGAASGATWQLHDFTWTNLTAHLTLSPPPDPTPALAYDASEGDQVLLDSREPGATWTYSASGWQQLSPAAGPPARTAATLVSDAGGGGVILFGGISADLGRQALNDTWRFAGGAWTQIATASAPPAQGRPTMSYDPRIPGVLLVASSGSSRTWTLAGDAWSLWPTAPEPALRTESSLYYDSNTGHDILLGGIDAAGATLTEAWGWSVPPPPVDPTIGSAPIGTVTWIEIGAIVAV
ncbi:MAG: hypothetical protein L3K06_02500, partial [Thermoplasmata archaeon]|nr:hypothetical protein [Thermoplasmata archaeon]